MQILCVDQWALVTMFVHTLWYARKLYLLYCPLCCNGLTEVEVIEIGYNKKAGGLVQAPGGTYFSILLFPPPVSFFSLFNYSSTCFIVEIS